MISSVAEDSEDEDGLELRSIQDSDSIMLALAYYQHSQAQFR